MGEGRSFVAHKRRSVARLSRRASNEPPRLLLFLLAYIIQSLRTFPGRFPFSLQQGRSCLLSVLTLLLRSPVLVPT